mgnify:CR=1 FL=1
MSSNRRQRGFTLIELLVFIVVVGIAASTLLAMMGNLARQAGAILPNAQALTVAAGLMDEILAKPFTFCDPDDANASTATSAAGCAGLPEAIGPEPGETRGGPAPFDNVNDYAGFGPVAITFPDASAVANLAGYTAQVAIQAAGAIAGVPAADTLRVTVIVTPPNAPPVRLQAVRIRHAPTT